MNRDIVDGLTLSLDGHSVCVKDAGVSGDHRRFEIRIDGRDPHELSFLKHYQAKYEVGSEVALFWAGTRLYLLNAALSVFLKVIRDDELHEVFFLKPLWCLRGETEVGLLDPASGEETTRFKHTEVIMESWLEGKTLVLRDFNQQLISLDLEHGTVRRAH